MAVGKEAQGAEMERKMKAYKGFDKDLRCRGFQYEIGEEYEESKAILCNRGFHACERPLDVLAYYPPATSRYCEVDLDATDEKNSDDTKRVGRKIKIEAELTIANLVKAHIEHVKENCIDKKTAGDSGVATAGYSGAATAGDSGVATAGYRGVATAGYSGAALSRGASASGDHGISVSRGSSVRCKGGIGALLVIAEEDNIDVKIKNWCAGVVDGKKIKTDTWYKCENGNFVEVEDEK